MDQQTTKFLIELRSTQLITNDNKDKTKRIVIRNTVRIKIKDSIDTNKKIFNIYIITCRVTTSCSTSTCHWEGGEDPLLLITTNTCLSIVPPYKKFFNVHYFTFLVELTLVSHF